MLIRYLAGALDVSGCSKSDLADILAVEEAWMRPADLAFWKIVRIQPVLWTSENDGDFWVVAVWENMYIWFNHIEEGFNIAPYEVYGRIQQMNYGQARLHQCLYEQGDYVVRSIRDAE
jgi:hypothetical protein